MMENRAEEITDEVWLAYQANRLPEIRNKILMAYVYIVKCTAAKMHAVFSNHADIDDIISCGTLALMDAIDRFDVHKGVRFDSYASFRVRGSVIDYLRKQDWIPRGLRKKAKDIEDCFSKLRLQLGREPDDREVAEAMGISVIELNEMIGEAAGFNIVSFEELVQDRIRQTPDGSGKFEVPDIQLQTDELKKMIAQSIDTLTEKERLVVSLFYYEELKNKEIAQMLNVSESRVSQLHSKALIRMKMMIKDYVLA